jgi:hypothetical protein
MSLRLTPRQLDTLMDLLVEEVLSDMAADREKAVATAARAKDSPLEMKTPASATNVAGADFHGHQQQVRHDSPTQPAPPTT